MSYAGRLARGSQATHLVWQCGRRRVFRSPRTSPLSPLFLLLTTSDRVVSVSLAPNMRVPRSHRQRRRSQMHIMAEGDGGCLLSGASDLLVRLLLQDGPFSALHEGRGCCNPLSAGW